MVFTAAQQTAFFTANDQMGLTVCTRAQLGIEGITDIDDLNWKPDEWDDFAANCRRPGQIPDPANAAQLIHQAPFILPVRSLKRLKVASALVRHYQATGRPLSAANMMWDPVITNFELQFDALKEAIKKDPPKIPKLKKGGSVTKWSPSFETILSQHFGTRGASIEYLVRPEAIVPAVAPVLQAGMPHSAVGGSIQADMKLRFSHNHPLYQMDNDVLYSLLDEAFRDSDFAMTIKPYERRRDGRGAYLSVMSNHAGDDKWDRIIETAEAYVQKKKWDGTSGVTLEYHIDKLKASYIDLEAGATHVPYTVPNARTRVKSLLSSIQTCTDPAVQATIASVKNELNGLTSDFEGTCRILVPVCPVSKKISNKRQHASISATSGEDTGWVPKGKIGVGKTGVEFRYYKPNLFRKLSKSQQDELKAWRKKNGNGGPKKGGGKSVKFDDKLKGKISSLVKAQLKEQVQVNAASDEKAKSVLEAEHREIAAIITSMRQPVVPAKSAVGAAVAAAEPYDALGMAAAISINKIIKTKRQNP